VRIEPGDVQAALLRHPQLHDGVVVAREVGEGERQLAAYVVPEPHASVTAAALRSFLLDELPEVMVPSTFTLLGALPLTPNGKVDRAALPAPEKAGAEGYLAPRTPTEERLAAIWAELLGVERVGA